MAFTAIMLFKHAQKTRQIKQANFAEIYANKNGKMFFHTSK